MTAAVLEQNSQHTIDPEEQLRELDRPTPGAPAVIAEGLQERFAAPGIRHRFIDAIRRHLHDEEGMSTIEYALGCVAAAALGALLYTVVTSDAVESALSGIFERALNEH
ncbi:DUF4244 domain-containing protein [Corynebacterium heidelbergense]|uniref:DUF4244 domain-containing protein n=1 Tax=Corynebacterium heidelbergense TaxID=2055947 RepID=UPI00268A575A|nr:hypothetical protein CHEID_09740 [Corynebacterium heidelbergense]